MVKFIGLISVGVLGDREMLIDETIIWSSDDTRGAGILPNQAPLSSLPLAVGTGGMTRYLHLHE